MKSLTDQLQIAYQEGLDKGKGLQIGMADPLPHPSKDVPQRPNPNAPPSSPWEPYKSPAPSRDDKLAHRSHEPSFTHGGIPRYGWGDDSHDPNQHRTPVDDYNNPIPSLTPTDEEIDSMNGLQISGNPFGYSDEYIHRSKALREIIDGRGYDPATVTEAQKQWIKLQQMGDIWKRAEASPLDKLLGPAQEKYGPGLKGMPNKERKDLLIKGTKLPKA